MGMYDARKKGIKDQDLVLFDNYEFSTVTATSDIVDLGQEQVFAQIPVMFFCEISKNFTLASSTLGAGGICQFPGLILQDSADGSTWVGHVFGVPFYYDGMGRSGLSTVSILDFNAKFPIGVGHLKRYCRASIPWTLNATATVLVTAWLRMGLTA